MKVAVLFLSAFIAGMDNSKSKGTEMSSDLLVAIKQALGGGSTYYESESSNSGNVP